MLEPEQAAARLLRIGTVEDWVGLKRSAIYQLIAQGIFPRPVKLGKRISVWPSDEVQAWITARISEGRGRDGAPSNEQASNIR